MIIYSKFEQFEFVAFDWVLVASNQKLMSVSQEEPSEDAEDI